LKASNYFAFNVATKNKKGRYRMKRLTYLFMVSGVMIALIGCSSKNDINKSTNPLARQTGSAIMPLQGEGDLGDLVWMDMNCNGIQDEDEAGMPGVQVMLFSCQDSLIDSTQTDSTGQYLFSQIPSGQYYLHFVLPAGYMFSPMDQGDDDAMDSDADTLTGNTECTTLDSAEVDMTWDAGLCQVEEEGCTLGKGYWKTHAGFGPQEDVVTPLLPLWLGLPDSSKSLDVTTAEIAHNVLVMFTYGRPSNGITKLYAQLLAAKLNIADGASDEDIAGTVAMADTFLAAYDWQDWTMLSGDQRNMVLSWMGHLGSYNEGEIGPGSCDGDHESGGNYGFDK
jgi:hypothetical protein